MPQWTVDPSPLPNLAQHWKPGKKRGRPPKHAKMGEVQSTESPPPSPRPMSMTDLAGVYHPGDSTPAVVNVATPEAAAVSPLAAPPPVTSATRASVPCPRCFQLVPDVKLHACPEKKKEEEDQTWHSKPVNQLTEDDINLMLMLAFGAGFLAGASLFWLLWATFSK